MMRARIEKQRRHQQTFHTRELLGGENVKRAREDRFAMMNSGTVDPEKVSYDVIISDRDRNINEMLALTYPTTSNKVNFNL